MNPDIWKTVNFGMYGLMVAGIFYCITITPMHELGHAAVCMYEGHDPVLTFNGNLGIRCEGIGQPFWQYYVMGGTFGVAAALALYGLGRVMHAPLLILAAIPIAVSQTGTAIMETAFHVEYILNPLASLLILIPAICVGCVLVTYRRSRIGCRLLSSG